MKETTVVIGCGEKGAQWISQNNGAGKFFGLDLQLPKDASGPLVVGDVFHLPFKPGSIDLILADFMVNGLVKHNREILENPDLLDTDYIPEPIKTWFNQKMHRSHESVRRNIKEATTILKIEALKEMWKMLKNNGRLQILDFDYNIDLILHYAPLLDKDKNPLHVVVEPLPIVLDDYNRSKSLGIVIKGSTAVQKLHITKRHPDYKLDLPLQGVLFPSASKNSP